MLHIAYAAKWAKDIRRLIGKKENFPVIAVVSFPHDRTIYVYITRARTHTHTHTHTPPLQVWQMYTKTLYINVLNRKVTCNIYCHIRKCASNLEFWESRIVCNETLVQLNYQVSWMQQMHRCHYVSGQSIFPIFFTSSH